MKTKQPVTIELSVYPARNYNYLDRLVDAEGIPYFNIFWGNPSAAAHDWPDWGDVMTRQFQAAIMGRLMTGKKCANEDRWRAKIKTYIAPDGMLYRPATVYSQNVADLGDAMLTFYSLTTAAIEDGTEESKKMVFDMAASLLKRYYEKMENFGFGMGFGIKGFMVAARYLNCKDALTLAGLVSGNIMNSHEAFSEDNNFRHGGHMHGNLRVLSGIADYALYINDAVMFSRVDAIYRYVVEAATTSFGFILEGTGRNDDIIGCETCTIMDYLGTAVTLANHGHPEYFDNIERIVRNHLIESQYNGGWLKGENKADSEYETTKDLGDRLVGAYAGWSSPTHFLAAKETLNAHWGQQVPHLVNRVRAFQNCCGGSGTHAFFIAWCNQARFDNNTLTVNLHLDKLLPQAEIRCFQPWEGRTQIMLKAACKVKIRIPDFIKRTRAEWKVKLNGQEIKPALIRGNYMYFDELPANSMLEYMYDLIEYHTTESIGNSECRQYRYDVTWKGATVVEMKPAGRQYKTGYSDFDKKNVEVFFGEDGPLRLYQREWMRKAAKAELSKLVPDSGKLNFWNNLSK